MPANYGLRPYYQQGSLPGKESGVENDRPTVAIIGSSRFQPPFRIKCKLSPEKEILSPQGCPGSETQSEKSSDIWEQGKRNGQEVVKRSDPIHRHAGCHTIVLHATAQAHLVLEALPTAFLWSTTLRREVHPAQEVLKPRVGA
jgi:hypothetical protein